MAVYTHTRLLFLLVVVAAYLAQPQRDFTTPRPTPRPNPDPLDTSNPRLVGKRFPHDQIPYQADTAVGLPRGRQTGYNRCNATTEGPTSLCQTAYINSLEDFCIYAPAQPNSIIGDVEGSMIAWCTKPGHGTRLIPPGTLKGVQFITTPSYVEVTGRFDQSMVNMVTGDSGGEVDSGGQDQRGNPVGGLVYSNSLPSSPNGPGGFAQAVVWHLFIGNDIFCMKGCDPNAPNALGLCEHVFDTYGCNVNVPAAYREGVFEQCEGEDQKPVQPGVTDIPASSNCVPRQSTDIFGVASATTTTTTTATTSAPITSGGTTPTGSRSSTSPSASSTNPPSAAQRATAAPGMLLAALLGAVGLLLGATVLV